MDLALKAFLCVILLLQTWSVDLAAQIVPVKPEQVFEFGKVGEHQTVEHTFSFVNSGPEPLEILNVQLSPPLVVTKWTRQIAPGETGSVTVRLGTPREQGPFRGGLVVNFKNKEAATRRFALRGTVVAPIEFVPLRGFFVSAPRGEPKEASIEIIVNESEPLQIVRVESPSAQFTTELETITEGKHFRLTLKMNPYAPPGRANETITLVTSSNDHPFIEIQANTWIKERVYSSPDTLDFGQIVTSELKVKPQLASFLSETLMVYQIGGKDFQAQVYTNVPFLHLVPARSPLKDRYQIEVTVIPEKLKAGEVNGFIYISTNDAERPQIAVPVKAVIQGSW
jgi:uncharacterized protein DUF1573